MENKKYKVVIAQSGKLDVKEKKKYILQQFKYREYAENFSKKIKKAVLALDTLPTGYNTTGFRYRGYDIYMKDNAKELSEQRSHSQRYSMSIIFYPLYLSRLFTSRYFSASGTYFCRIFLALPSLTIAFNVFDSSFCVRKNRNKQYQKQDSFDDGIHQGSIFHV